MFSLRCLKNPLHVFVFVFFNSLSLHVFCSYAAAVMISEVFHMLACARTYWKIPMKRIISSGSIPHYFSPGL